MARICVGRFDTLARPCYIALQRKQHNQSEPMRTTLLSAVNKKSKKQTPGQTVW